MEVNSRDLLQLGQELKELQDYLARVHQYHLGAKPSFMHRNHWNSINDALHNSSIRANSCYSLASKLVAERADIVGRPAQLREVQGKGSSVGSQE